MHSIPLKGFVMRHMPQIPREDVFCAKKCHNGISFA